MIILQFSEYVDFFLDVQVFRHRHCSLRFDGYALGLLPHRMKRRESDAYVLMALRSILKCRDHGVRVVGCLLF